MKLGSLFDGSGGFPLAGALPIAAEHVEHKKITVPGEQSPA